MSAKQDRTAARTAADLERKYNFDKSYGEVIGIATDARNSASNAVATANACRSEIVKLADSITLKVTGGEAGNTASIVLTVGEEEYTGEINLTGLVTFESLQESGTTQINGDNIVSVGVDDNDDPVRLRLQGGQLLIDRQDYTEAFATVLALMVRASGVRFTSEEGLEISGRRGSHFGGLLSPTTVQGTDVNINGLLFINDHQCSWEKRSDGKYILVGTR